jgi:hypothetical protein
MKRNRTVVTLVSVVTLGLGIGAATSASAGTAPEAVTTGSSIGSGSTSTALAASLAFSREEERMARDLYAALAAAYDGARPMSMITRSEQMHFDAIGTQLSTRGLADPSAGLPAGSYANPELQKLYDEWLAQGKSSLQAAYTVGVELEKRDIADLEAAVAATDDTAAKAVFERLLAGSRNHLAAYENAASGGTVGDPAGQHEGGMNGQGMYGQGNGQGMGQGMGNGQGNGQGAMGGPGSHAGDGQGSCAADAS